jgi:hypothetical protein
MTTYANDLDAWTNMPCDPPSTYFIDADEEEAWGDVERAIERRAEAMADREEDRLRREGLA